MPARVDVWYLKGNHRSLLLAQALSAGLGRTQNVVREDRMFLRPEARVAAFYGYKQRMGEIFHAYRDSGRTVVFLDLGYWKRREGGRHAGYHKVSVNDRHPTAYLNARNRNHERLDRLGLTIEPRRNGKNIIVAGMSDKSAISYGLEPEAWERRTIKALRQLTDRPIIYRPKPSYMGARQLAGAGWSRKEPIEALLADAHAVVAHHSNVAVDAIRLGVPAFVWDGVAVPMASQNLEEIETPVLPEGRRQWLANIAWWQWKVDEIRSGAMWRFLRDEGLV